MSATTTTDTAYLAIIDDLEARLAALETVARAILPAAAHGIAEAYVRSQRDAYQAAYDALAALLEDA